MLLYIVLGEGPKGTLLSHITYMLGEPVEKALRLAYIGLRTVITVELVYSTG
jgi:hypothetical protein